MTCKYSKFLHEFELKNVKGQVMHTSDSFQIKNLQIILQEYCVFPYTYFPLIKLKNEPTTAMANAVPYLQDCQDTTIDLNNDYHYNFIQTIFITKQ